MRAFNNRSSRGIHMLMRRVTRCEAEADLWLFKGSSHCGVIKWARDPFGEARQSAATSAAGEGGKNESVAAAAIAREISGLKVTRLLVYAYILTSSPSATRGHDRFCCNYNIIIVVVVITIITILLLCSTRTNLEINCLRDTWSTP